MGKRLVYIITSLLITGLVIGWYFFAKESKDFGTSPLRAVSDQVPCFIRIKNLGDFAGKSVHNTAWKSIGDLKELSHLNSDILFLDSLFQQNKEAETFFKHKELILVPYGNTRLFLLEIGSIAEKNSLQSLVKQYFASRNITSQTEKYKNASFYHFEWNEKGGRKRLYFSYHRGVMMMANEAIFLESAIDQMDKRSVLDDVDFLRIEKNSAVNIDLNIFINHRKLHDYLSSCLTDSVPSGVMMKQYATWSEVDIIQKERKWLINGFTVTDSSSNCYLDIFRHQKPLPISLAQCMPITTTSFLLQNLSNIQTYFEDIERFRLQQEVKLPIGKNMADMSKILKLDMKQYLNESWTGEAAGVFTNLNLEDRTDNIFLLLKVKSDKNDLLINACKRWTTTNFQRSDFGSEDPNVSNIWKIPYESFGNLINENCFGFVQTKWITSGNGFILMGPTYGALKRYMNLIKGKQILEEDTLYQKNADGQAKNCSFFLWNSPAKSLPFMKPMFQASCFNSFMEQMPLLLKLENFSWQWGFENNLFYNTASLSVNPFSIPIQSAFWSYPLKAKIVGDPFFVSFYGGEGESCLIFQDDKNYLTAIDKDGIEKWRISLEGPVMGEMKVIDSRGNGQNQLLFNTAGAIHLIDKRGIEVKNFPIKLDGSATNEVAVLDYDGKKDFRYLIACNNHKIYNFDKFGKVTSGWQSRTAEGVVEFPVRHFRNGTKDYLVLFDKAHTFILDRQGKERVKVREEFTHSKNNFSLIKDNLGRTCLVTTDLHGKIIFLGFDGSVRKRSFGNFSADHFFLPIDFTGSGKFKFLFFDKKKMSLFDASGKEMFSKEMESDGQRPKLVQIGNERLIALNLIQEEKTLLIRENGLLFDPLQQKDLLLKAIGSFGEQNKMMNWIVLTSDGSLLNYQMALE